MCEREVLWLIDTHSTYVNSQTWDYPRRFIRCMADRTRTLCTVRSTLQRVPT